MIRPSQDRSPATGPVRDAYEAYDRALREYEAAHARWMDTSVFSPQADQVRAERDEACGRLLKARLAYFQAQGFCEKGKEQT